MSLPEYIIRRGNALYYRRAWPPDIWPLEGKGKGRSFSRSLRTDTLSEAKRARAGAERAFYAEVDKARLELARRKQQRPLTRDAAQTLAVQWFLEALDSADELRTATDPETLERRVEDAEWSASEARRALAEGELADETRLARCLREAAGLASEPMAEAALVRLLGRAAVALYEVEAGRVLARYETRPRDPLFASALDAPPPPLTSTPTQGPYEEAPTAPSGLTVADLEREYRAARLLTLAPSSRPAYEPVFRVMREVLGADTPLAGVRLADGQRLFETVQALPVNAAKRLRGLTVAEQIAEGKRRGLPTLSPKTVNEGYLTNMGTVFRFAQERGWMNLNPVQGRRVRDEVAAAEKREPFAGRLPVLFGAAPWRPRDAAPDGHPVRYWGPLLALYQGLRLAEIVGLAVADVGEEQGQPMLYIRAGERRLKGRGSRRDMPVHPELVRLGFLSFVKARRKAAKADETLFPGERPNSRGQWGRRLSVWFAAHVRSLGLAGRGLTLHALRHDYRDALREAGIDDPLADYLFGHAPTGTRAIYGGQRPYSLARLAEATRKVRYPTLVLPA